MDPFVIKAVIATPDGAFTIPLPIQHAVVGCDIVLARNIKSLAGLCTHDDLLCGVELAWLRRLRDIAGVQQQLRRRGETIDLVVGFLQLPRHILICRLVETDMAVADLNKAESGSRMGTCRIFT